VAWEKIMQTVITTKAIDRWPFRGIPAGERGIVIDIDEKEARIPQPDFFPSIVSSAIP
jgi:hypothetical protein